MSDGYELVEYQLDEQHKFWELKNSSHDQSELQKAIANRRLRESCNKLFFAVGQDNRLWSRYIMPDGKAQVLGSGDWAL